ncbi:MAG: YCF48-related protein [Myxococcota bacterium]
MLARRCSWVLLCSALALPACQSDDDTDDEQGPNNPSPSSWLVGDQGEMLRLTSDEGEVSTYPLEIATDLTGIACMGQATAWVAGERGTVLVSHDAGEAWTTIDIGTTADLRSIAVSESLPGQETVWVTGDDGAALRTTDGGRTWNRVPGPALDFSAVATQETGDIAFFTALDGSVWRSAHGDPMTEALSPGDHALYDVALSHHGDTVVVVGEAGHIWLSHDGGARFAALEAATALDLHAVHLAQDRETLVAVGEAGVVVRIDPSGARVQQTLGPGQALYDLHLRADGLGQAVGMGGVVLLTEDAGQQWRPVETGYSNDLWGVDDFHTTPHL